MSFFVAVALVAAALGDCLVESVANTGLFGHSYFDANHLSIVPALIAGGLLGVEVLGLRIFALCRGATLRDAAASLSARSPHSDLVAIFALQLVALFGMENAESLLAGGHLVGGSAWLGAPIFVAFLAHLIVGAGCALVLRRGLRVLSSACASFVSRALEGVLAVANRARTGAFAGRRVVADMVRPQSPLVRHIGGRAPPRSLTPA